MDKKDSIIERQPIGGDTSFEELLREQIEHEDDSYKELRNEIENGAHPSAEILYHYVMGALEDQEVEAIMKHIAHCSLCSREAVNLRYTHRAFEEDFCNWLGASSVLQRIVESIKSLTSFEPLEFELGNPATSSATSVRGISSLGDGLGTPSLSNVSSFLAGAVLGLGAAIRKPGTKERKNKGYNCFKIGDPLLFTLSIPAEGHILVIHHDGADRLNLVFPSGSSGETYVTAGETKRIPGHVEGPAGKQFLKAIWTAHPLVGTTSIDFTDQSSVEKALESFIEQLGKMKPDKWREVLCEFEVQEK